MKTILLLCALIVGGGSVWAADPVTIATFTVASHTGWTIEADGNSNSPTYYLLIAADKYIESPSIVFSNYKNVKITIKARKYGGPSNDQKVVSIYQGSTSNVLGSYGGPSGTSLVNSSAISISPSDGKIRVACLGASSSKGCGVSEITITGEEVSTDADSEASFTNTAPSLDLKDAGSFTQSVSTATGYSGTVTYSITSDTAGSTIDSSTGEVTPTKAGSVTVKASAAKVTGSWAASSATYTLTVTDSRASAGLSWSSSSVEIEKNADSYTLPTLSNPNSLLVTYTITGTDGLASESAGIITIDTSVEGTATVKASFAGDRSYKPATVSYTIEVADFYAKGGKYNPYSVAEVIALNPTSSTVVKENVYVTGYIIGTCVTSGTNAGDLINTNIDSDTNLAIADLPTATSGHCSLQLPSGAIRTALNIKASGHPYYLACAKVMVKGDIAKYCGIPGVKNTKEGKVVGQSVKVTSAGLATYCTDVNLKFDGTLEAYIAQEDNGAIKLQQITNVPANTGILLRAPGISVDTSYDVETTTDEDATTGNLFVKGTGAAVDSGSGPYNYILNKIGDVVGFYKANGQTVAKNRAYLQTTVASARIAFDFDNETTGINASLVNNQQVKGDYFNIAGLRVAHPTKGLYIVNGKKVIVK